MSMTPAREQFANQIAAGKNQSEAYRIAYPKSRKWKEGVVWRRASELIAVGEVSERVAELRAETAAKGLWLREDSVRTLLANMADPEAKPSDKNAAVKILNEMHGYNAPLKIDHRGTVAAVVVPPMVEANDAD